MQNKITLDVPLLKQWLKIDHDLDDLELELCLQGAISNVKNTIGIEPGSEEELDTELYIVTLNLAAYFYQNKLPVREKQYVPDHIYQSILFMHKRNIL